MKQHMKKLLALLLACIAAISAAIPAHAAQPEDEVLFPAYAVPINASCTCSVSEDSTLYIVSSYAVAADAQVTRVDITVYVEKRNLLVLWDRVDINQPNDEWTTICYGRQNEAAHSVVISPGTYRVTSIFEVYNGTTLIDTIEKTTNSFTN